MKKFFKFFLIILLALFLLVAVVLTHAGLFEPVTTSKEKMGPYTIVYQEHQGAYHKTKPAMDEIYNGLLEMGIETYRGVGIYYDDPQQVPATQLRSEVGSILEEQDLDRLEEIKQVFQVKTIPHQESIVAQFPIRSILSYMVAPAKVYKEVGLVWQAGDYPDYGYTVEIYDVSNKMITYLLPIQEIITEKVILEEPLVIDVNKPETSESTSTSDLEQQLKASESASASGVMELELETNGF